jgi:hypothetical protein
MGLTHNPILKPFVTFCSNCLLPFCGVRLRNRGTPFVFIVQIEVFSTPHWLFFSASEEIERQTIMHTARNSQSHLPQERRGSSQSCKLRFSGSLVILSVNKKNSDNHAYCNQLVALSTYRPLLHWVVSLVGCDDRKLKSGREGISRILRTVFWGIIVDCEGRCLIELGGLKSHSAYKGFSDFKPISKHGSVSLGRAERPFEC